MSQNIRYQFSGSMWKHSDVGGWHFISMPFDMSKEIRDHHQWQEEGWGRMKAKAALLGIQWDTSIWFDTKSACYILPVKAAIRKKTGLKVDVPVAVEIWV